MTQKIDRKKQVDAVNNLSVKSYLEILGYDSLISARGYALFPAVFPKKGIVYVDNGINKFRIGQGKHIGGVLDLATMLFGVSRTAVLKNIALYRIDQLMSKCENR
ncbi:hypothetical protein Q4E93_13190 [Flavitalea sp. BT771]|uniref:hypothetical protein n=1 Tax=Flavitalea sp. BT771 TaxID=3063329 RepID=UPI0026E33B94|nr:hypothetical protein [Flavitalea sp. BT771]MDO6431553.1 hypothetical protein [Flavitalea sp. BT771]MDV6220461.1 hypothetical protein [Flavitalea sp. BT771]